MRYVPILEESKPLNKNLYLRSKKKQEFYKNSIEPEKYYCRMEKTLTKKMALL